MSTSMVAYFIKMVKHVFLYYYDSFASCLTKSQEEMLFIYYRLILLPFSALLLYIVDELKLTCRGLYWIFIVPKGAK
jgi:hypothetical protein